MAEVTEPTSIWKEDTNGLEIIFPKEDLSGGKGCAWTLLIIVSLLALCFPVIVLTGLTGGNGITLWMLFPLIVEAFVLLLWWKCYSDIHAPEKLPQPSVIRVNKISLLVERVGRSGKRDVIWDRAEIADIRLSIIRDLFGTMFNMLHPWEFFLQSDECFVQICVELPSGKYEATKIATIGEEWIPDVEKRLRNYLGLSPDPVVT